MIVCTLRFYTLVGSDSSLGKGKSLRNFYRNLSVVQRVYDRYRATGEYKRLAGQSRKWKTTRIADRYLVLFYVDENLAQKTSKMHLGRLIR